MAEEKKAYKKAKEREKSSLDKRKYDSECKVVWGLFCFASLLNRDKMRDENGTLLLR